MDKSFIKFFSEKKDVAKIALVLGLGLILIFIGSGSYDTVEAEPDVEERIAAVCSDVDGVGNCSVLVYYTPSSRGDEQKKVESVIVICEGADSLTVRLTLTEMLSSFFGIGTNRIRIEKMRK